MTAPGPTGGTPRPRGRPRPTARDAAIRELVASIRQRDYSWAWAYASAAAQYGLTPATVRRIVAPGRRGEKETP